ncbi:MAG: hypothetical protein K6G80_03570, partial [Treponema sp.]|nr:hypothetical protein [Treponema sp.]
MRFIYKCLQCTVPFFFLLTAHLAAADDWVLAARSFTFESAAKPAGAEQISTLLPQLILEQISTGGTRVLPSSEVLSRTLDSLQTERLSLFLQLSKEYKTRDALVLSVVQPRSLEKQLAAEQKKIAEIEKQIDENLASADKAVSENAAAIEREEAVSQGLSQNDAFENDEKRFPFQIPFPIFRRDAEEKKVSEFVTLYKNDITALFTPSEAALSEGADSRTFEKEVVAAKINGLLSGTIIAYGDYIAVTVSLSLFPGGKTVATITEVGLSGDLLSIAERIVRALTPKLTNSLPVIIHLAVMPEDAAEKAMLTVDGIVIQSIPRELSLDSAIHTISVASPGYETASVTYMFEARARYDMKVSLVPEVKGTLSLRLKKFQDGIFYASGIDSAAVTEQERTARITVNGKSVLGIFTTGSGESDTSAFIYLPARLARENASLVVNAHPYDRAANIDKRRRRMYTAYS